MFDIFCLAKYQSDPLPTVVLEALACGKPVVAYRHGGVCEMVKEGKNDFLLYQISLQNYQKSFKNWRIRERNQFGQASVESKGIVFFR